MTDINHLGPRYPPNRLSRVSSLLGFSLGTENTACPFGVWLLYSPAIRMIYNVTILFAHVWLPQCIVAAHYNLHNILNPSRLSQMPQ